MSAASTLDRLRRHPLAAHLEASSGAAPIHAVGGVVRDALLGRDSADLDLTVAERGERLARRLARASGGTPIVLGGDRFSSYRVVAGAFQADIWDREGKSLRSDLARRDLTINSVACALDAANADDGLEDPFGGVEDLAARTLRATKPDCFARDPLRVLRLARFRLLLEGFEIEPRTASAARAAAPGLPRVASERIRDEMQRVLESSSTASAFETLQRLAVLEALVPATAHEAVARDLLERSRRLDRTLAALDASAPSSAARPRAPWDGPDRRDAALALLAAAAADDAKAGAVELETRGVATRRTLAAALGLRDEILPETENERRLFLDRHRHRWRLALAVSAALTQRADREVTAAAARLDRTAHSTPGLLDGLPPLLDGHQAARILGIGPGPELGRALEALGRARAVGRVASRTEAEDFLRKRRSWAARGPGEAATSTKPEDAG